MLSTPAFNRTPLKYLMPQFYLYKSRNSNFWSGNFAVATNPSSILVVQDDDEEDELWLWSEIDHTSGWRWTVNNDHAILQALTMYHKLGG